MKTVTADIWKESTARDVVVIPTNIGWRKDGSAVMGTNLAKDAVLHWPWITHWYGHYCQEFGADSSPVAISVAGNKCLGLILFPVKPLNVEQPHLSWRSPASINLIMKGLVWLQGWARALQEPSRVLVPALGCGSGSLSRKVVVPYIHERLTLSCFVHVDLEV